MANIGFVAGVTIGAGVMAPVAYLTGSFHARFNRARADRAAAKAALPVLLRLIIRLGFRGVGVAALGAAILIAIMVMQVRGDHPGLHREQLPPVPSSSTSHGR